MKYMEIKNSQFVISAPTVDKCPNDNKAEYALLGEATLANRVSSICFAIIKDWQKPVPHPVRHF